MGTPAGMCLHAEPDIPNLNDQLLQRKGSTFVHKGHNLKHLSSELIPCMGGTCMGGIVFEMVSKSRLVSQWEDDTSHLQADTCEKYRQHIGSGHLPDVDSDTKCLPRA